MAPWAYPHVRSWPETTYEKNKNGKFAINAEFGGNSGENRFYLFSYVVSGQDLTWLYAHDAIE